MGGPYTLFIFSDTNKKTTVYDTFDRALFEATKIEKSINLDIYDNEMQVLVLRVNGVSWHYSLIQEFANKYPYWSIHQYAFGEGIIEIAQSINADYSSFFELQIKQDIYGNCCIRNTSLHGDNMTPEMAGRLSEGLNIASEICLALQPKET